jgi:putative membrane protein
MEIVNNTDKQNDKVIFRIVMGVTLAVCVLVVLLNIRIFPVPDVFPQFIYKLPMLNAFINGTCSILLICSLIAIKKRNITLHKRLNLTAFFLSVLFLLSYVSAHYFIPDTKFGDLDHNGIVSDSEYALVSGIKPVYLAILLSHIGLAVIVLPLVLLSFYYGLRDDRVKHRKLTRFSFPIWLYVTVTGVIVYLMISPYYNY